MPACCGNTNSRTLQGILPVLQSAELLDLCAVRDQAGETQMSCGAGGAHQGPCIAFEWAMAD